MKKKDRKHFVFRDENYLTKSNGGCGNKRGWRTFMPLWFYKQKKEQLKILELIKDYEQQN